MRSVSIQYIIRRVLERNRNARVILEGRGANSRPRTLEASLPHCVIYIISKHKTPTRNEFVASSAASESGGCARKEPRPHTSIGSTDRQISASPTNKERIEMIQALVCVVS